jgi:predicted nucleic acid-binding protein
MITKTTKVFFDTNVLVYAVTEDDARSSQAEALLAVGGVISVQILNEFASVARRKLSMSWTDVAEALAAILDLCPTPVPITLETHQAALRIAEKFGYGIYDSLVVAAALQAECATLFSEDFQDGQIIEAKLTIRNPFQRKS